MRAALTHCADIRLLDVATALPQERGCINCHPQSYAEQDFILSTKRRVDEKSSAKEQSTSKQTAFPCAGNSPQRAAAALPQGKGVH